MPRPMVVDSHNYMTSSQVSQALGIGLSKLYRRLAQGVLPAPTRVTPGGVRLFDQSWLRAARAILEGGHA